MMEENLYQVIDVKEELGIDKNKEDIPNLI